MFTDLHEEIEATFSRLSVCVDGGCFESMHLLNHAKKERTAHDHRLQWKADKKKYESDPVARERKLQSQRDCMARWTAQNPEAYQARKEARRAVVAASPELQEKRREAKRKWSENQRKKKRLLNG
jgi:hypothetical protein